VPFHVFGVTTNILAGDSPNRQFLWSCGWDQHLRAGSVSRVGLVLHLSDLSSDTTVHPLHTAPRSPGMDASVWEVNFNHRDDALNALMASLLLKVHLASSVLNSIRL